MPTVDLRCSSPRVQPRTTTQRANVGCAVEAESRPSRAKGDPPPGDTRALWRGADAQRPRRHRWRAGWDREETIPGSLLRSSRERSLRRYRSGGYAQGPRHYQAAVDLAWVVELCRQGAYGQRADLAIDPDWSETRQAGARPDGTPIHYEVSRYDADPSTHHPHLSYLAGREVVDLADVARRLRLCEAGWRLQARLRADGIAVVSTPIRCGQTRICPHCAGARALRRAGQVRRAIERGIVEGEIGELALMTATQRAVPGERLAEALERLRGSLSRLVTKKRMSPSRRAWWDALVAGVVWSVEATRGASGDWWHVHAHAVVALRPGVDHEEAARRLGASWERLSGEESGSGLGWDPCSGGVPEDRSRWATGGWWRPIDPGSLAEVYQATKYLCKPTSLDSTALLELLTVTRGSRLQGATGVFVGMVSAAADEPQGEEADTLSRPDAGRALARLWDCPDEDGEEEIVSWPIQPIDVPEVQAALDLEAEPATAPVLVEVWDQLTGGSLWRLVTSRAWAHARAASHSAAVARADLAQVEGRVANRLAQLAEQEDRLSLDGQRSAVEVLQKQSLDLVSEISEAAQRADRWETLGSLALADLERAPPLPRPTPGDDLPY